GQMDEEQGSVVGSGRRGPCQTLELGEIQKRDQGRRDQPERAGDTDDPERRRLAEPATEVRWTARGAVVDPDRRTGGDPQDRGQLRVEDDGMRRRSAVGTVPVRRVPGLWEPGS